MKPRFLLVFLSMLCVSFTLSRVPPIRAEAPPPGGYERTRQAAARFIEAEMARQRVKGLSIALIDGERLVWARGFGYADAARKIAAAAGTIYPAGPVSKLITDALVMQLAEQGRLDLDGALPAQLPGYAVRSRFPPGRPVTARNIMTHHAGLPADNLKQITRAEMAPGELAAALLDEYAAYPPDYVYAYANTGFTLLGLLVERLTGEDFASVARREVLLPLGMKDSSFTPPPGGERSLSRSYDADGREVKPLRLGNIPAGGLYTTVLDLSRFVRMILAGDGAGQYCLLSQAAVDEMLRPQNTDIPLDLDLRVGIGWFLNGLDLYAGEDLEYAGKVAWHSGDAVFGASMVAILPEHKLGVVVMANSTGGIALSAKAAVKTLQLALEEKTGRARPQAPVQPPAAEAAGDLGRYEGYYVTEAGLTRIDRRGARLGAVLFGMKFDLVAGPDGWLRPRYLLLGCIPLGNDTLRKTRITFARVAGRDIAVLAYNGKRYLFGTRAARVPLGRAWSRRLGDYEIANLRADDYPVIDGVALRERDGFLVVSYAVPYLGHKDLTLVLAPLSETEAVVMGLGRDKGGTVRIRVVEGEELLCYAGYEFRRKAVP